MATYDEDLDALAAEYVLGTLSAEERAHAEAMLSIDPGFAELVRQWERRLGELNVMVEAVEPPPELWEKIKAEVSGVAPAGPQAGHEGQAPPLPLMAAGAELEGEEPPPVEAFDSSLVPPGAETELEAAPHDEPEVGAEGEAPVELPVAPAAFRVPPRVERSAEVVYLARRVRRWRGLTLVTGAIAALLALFIGVTQFAPNLIPAGKLHIPQLFARGPAPGAPAGNRLVAVLQQDPTSPAFLLTVDTPSRTLTVRRVTTAPQSGRSYELWLIPPRTRTPRSLGVVGANEFTQRALPANVDLDTVRGATYAISFEPAGGSPKDTPTGPILFTGKLVETLPAAQPKT